MRRGRSSSRERLDQLAPCLNSLHIHAPADGKRWVEAKDLLELVDVIHLCTHRDVGDTLNDEFQDDWHLILVHKSMSLSEGIFEFIDGFHSDRLAAKPLRDSD